MAEEEHYHYTHLGAIVRNSLGDYNIIEMKIIETDEEDGHQYAGEVHLVVGLAVPVGANMRILDALDSRGGLRWVGGETLLVYCNWKIGLENPIY